MQNQYCRFLLHSILLILLVLISGLSWPQTDSNIDGLKPIPKLLKGSIKDNYYLFPNKDFQIALPHKEGTEEFRYMQIKEQVSELSTYVSFGPSELDRRIFRVEASIILNPTAPRPTIEAMANEAFPAYIAQIERAYEASTELITFKTTEINGVTAVFGLYRQKIKPRVSLAATSNSNYTRLHALYLIYQGTYGALFWVEVPNTDPDLEASMEKETYLPVIDFVSSLNRQN